jgi:hypothetical protein
VIGVEPSLHYHIGRIGLVDLVFLLVGFDREGRAHRSRLRLMRLRGEDMEVVVVIEQQLEDPVVLVRVLHRQAEPLSAEPL